jgi:hypothetical protein
MHTMSDRKRFWKQINWRINWFVFAFCQVFNWCLGELVAPYGGNRSGGLVRIASATVSALLLSMMTWPVPKKRPFISWLHVASLVTVSWLLRVWTGPGLYTPTWAWIKICWGVGVALLIGALAAWNRRKMVEIDARTAATERKVDELLKETTKP